MLKDGDCWWFSEVERVHGLSGGSLLAALPRPTPVIPFTRQVPACSCWMALFFPHAWLCLLWCSYFQGPNPGPVKEMSVVLVRSSCEGWSFLFRWAGEQSWCLSEQSPAWKLIAQQRSRAVSCSQCFMSVLAGWLWMNVVTQFSAQQYCTFTWWYFLTWLFHFFFFSPPQYDGIILPGK